MSAGTVNAGTMPRIEGRPLPWDQGRGTAGMALFILTEALLFACLFFAYFYLASAARGAWPTSPPHLPLALAMLAVLLSSSGVLTAGERAERAGRTRSARLAVGLTIALGLAFLGLQTLEYSRRLREIRPSTDAYGSLFYTITTLHGAHVVLGLGMLCFVLALPAFGPRLHPPHHPLRNASLYWHFVDALWVVIVALLYVLPAVRG